MIHKGHRIILFIQDLIGSVYCDFGMLQQIIANRKHTKAKTKHDRQFQKETKQNRRQNSNKIPPNINIE